MLRDPRIQEYIDIVKKAYGVLLKNVRVFNGYRIVVPHPVRYPVPFCWDTAFHALGLIYVDPLLARENIEGLLSHQREDGLIPNALTSDKDTDLRSQPPIIIYSAVVYAEATNDLDSLRRWYPRLKKYYLWWAVKGALGAKNPGDLGEDLGALVSPFTGSRDPSHPWRAYWAACSSGMDNHPVYDYSEGRVIEHRGNYYLPIKDLMLSSSLAAGAGYMMKAARMLGMPQEETFFRREHERLKRLINEYMWDDSSSFYYPITLEGDKIKVKTIQAFIPLYAEVASRGDAEELINHLVSKDEFWGTYGVPSIAFNDKKFMTPQPSCMHARDPYYWRGPIWAPTTYLVFRGLLNYGKKDLAKELVDKWISLLARVGDFVEYYYPTGEPGATNLSGFSWTAAVTIAMLVEIGYVGTTDISNIFNE